MSDLYRRATDDERMAHALDYGHAVPILGIPVTTDASTLWCFTHYRIPEDGTDLCGDEWRDIGPCDFGKAVIVRVDAAVKGET